MMVSALRKRVYTEEEYLLLEERAEQRSEFYNGEIFALAGGSINHNRITGNVFTAFASELRGRSCESFTSDMRLLVKANGLFTYPDVMVVCDEIEFPEDHDDIVTNPVVIVEVLSPSTATYDRTQKFELYRQLTSLRDYVIIYQDRVLIEHHHRMGDRRWLFTEYDDASAELTLESIDCTIPIVDLYSRVDWFGEEGSVTNHRSHG